MPASTPEFLAAQIGQTLCNMKVLLLLPLLLASIGISASHPGVDAAFKRIERASTAKHTIRCIAEDFVFINNLELTCSGSVPQFCYTTDKGGKGCATLEICQKMGWKCCNSNLCNK
ncbi:uncharacterized protein wu:fj16a03 [Polypterus senegalus]|uniref:uncharacterized protein wu:fj16a03 n=1 Tax=Polypterus senegalus TaxID=55291 RepID=UPI0019666CE8|nr:uncharacterized protein wu:fj16a03 [Polypterus senegalus]